ncbi:MAG TPA: hypothetical protein VGF70_16195 [Solirubrobacteraceae bacterium]
MSSRPPNLLLWFGVAGGACAFALQFVAGLAFSYAQCNPPMPRWHLAIHDWQSGLAAAGLLVALASAAVSILIFRRTYRVGDVFGQERRGDGSPPPLGRVHFLSIVGITVNLLIIPLIIMDGVGAGLASICQQT